MDVLHAMQANSRIGLVRIALFVPLDLTHHHLGHCHASHARLGSTTIRLVNHLVLNVDLELTILILVQTLHLLVWIVHRVLIFHSQVPPTRPIALIVRLVDMEQV